MKGYWFNDKEEIIKIRFQWHEYRELMNRRYLP